MQEARVRLHVEQALAPGQAVALGGDQAHYLFTVMRLAPGRAVLLFNGRHGEWRAEVVEAGRRGGVLVCREQTRPLRLPPDLWLLFAPLKKTRTDFIVEKATELGAARILPVQTAFTNAERIRQDRLQAHAVEAAEQCGGTFVPQVADLVALDRLLDGWPAERRLLWCNEHLAGVAEALSPAAARRGAGAGASGGDICERKMDSGLAEGPAGPWAILVGPEGGFSEAEQARLAAMPQVVQAGLGPRILRADTAAVAALVLWQAVLGDWR